MIATIGLILLAAVILEPLIRRDLTRARTRHVVTVRITADIGQYVDVMRRVARAAAELDRAMREVRETMDGAAPSLKALRAHLEAEQAAGEKTVF